MKKRIGKGVFVVILLAFLAVFLIPFPVRRELTAIECRLSDPSWNLSREIHVEGVFCLNLFFENTFKGVIRIEGYPMTQLRIDGTVPVSLKNNEPRFCSYAVPEVLPYLDGQNIEKKDVQEIASGGITFANLYSKAWMRDMVLEIIEDRDLSAAEGRLKNSFSFSEVDGLFLVTDVKDREEAVRLIKNYIEDR